MSHDAITWQALSVLLTLLIGFVSLMVSIRTQFKNAQDKSDERARRTYEKIEGLRGEIAQTYVRKDVYDVDRRLINQSLDENMRVTRDVARRLDCPAHKD